MAGHKKRAPRGKGTDAAAKKQKVEKEEVKSEEEAGQTTERQPPEETLRKIKEQARVAVSSLQSFVAAKGEKSLFPEADHGLSVLITYKKPALVNGKTQKKRIVLPHPPLAASSASFCVIMPDLDISDEAKRCPQVDKQALEWEEKIEAAHGLTRKHIAKVMTKTQLERECNTFRARRQLASAYDVFLVEKTVHKSVHSHLGKEFIRAHKLPLSFDFSRDMRQVLQKAAATSVFDLTAHRVRVAVSAGHLSQPFADVVANVEHVISEMLAHCPGGLPNVRSLFVQLASSTPSLPVYSDDGSANEVKLEAPPKKRREDKELRGELTTLPEGLEVAVTRGGRVRVLREDTGVGVVYPTVKDEWTDRDHLKPKTDLEKLAKRRKNKKKRSEQKKKQAQGVKTEEGAFAAIAKGAKRKAEDEVKEETKRSKRS